MLPAALCLGILWREVFTAEGLANLVFGNRPGPALGAAVFTAVIWAFVLLSPGWQASARQSASRVEKRTALALPVLSTERFASVMPTFSACSRRQIRCITS